jgi:Ulp1 family protease
VFTFALTLPNLFLDLVLKQFSCEAQDNSYDCGLHVLLNARLIGDYVKVGIDHTLDKNGDVPTAFPAAAQEMRTTLVQLIKQLANK